MWTVNSRVIVQTLVPDNMPRPVQLCQPHGRVGHDPVAAMVVGVLAQAFSYRVAFGTFAVLCLALVYPFFRVVTPSAMAEVDRVFIDQSHQ